MYKIMGFNNNVNNNLSAMDESNNVKIFKILSLGLYFITARKASFDLWVVLFRMNFPHFIL